MQWTKNVWCSFSFFQLPDSLFKRSKPLSLLIRFQKICQHISLFHVEFYFCICFLCLLRIAIKSTLLKEKRKQNGNNNNSKLPDMFIVCVCNVCFSQIKHNRETCSREGNDKKKKERAMVNFHAPFHCCVYFFFFHHLFYFSLLLLRGYQMYFAKIIGIKLKIHFWFCFFCIPA